MVDCLVQLCIGPSPIMSFKSRDKKLDWARTVPLVDEGNLDLG